jgi:hypothetical protein
MSVRTVAAVALALSLAACAAPTVYGPADGRGRGYAERAIEPGRWRVTFAGNSATPRAEVETAALHRAAEVALANGSGHFRVVRRDVVGDARDGGVGFGLGVFHHPRFDGGLGVGVGVSDAGGATRWEATLEILLVPPPADPADPDVYDARGVLAEVGPTLSRA